jgi:thiamine-phosphate pyrophosphorylase
VVEDYVRFALDDRLLTDSCKQLRHRLAAGLAQIDSLDRNLARDTAADVGTMLTTSSEQSRVDPWHVAQASLKRSQQALRSLEEYGKLLTAETAKEFERLRYDVYTLERTIDIVASSRLRLEGARLYVLIDGCASLAEFTELAGQLVAAGVHLLQLRDKQLPDRDLIERARALCETCWGSNTLAIINDRADIAARCGADGVHVGQDDLSVKDARAIVGPRRLVGLSTHSIEQARQAVQTGANYIGVGPTFPSTTKAFDDFAGLHLIRAVAAEITLPAFALGGVNLENIDQIRAAGLSRVAVSAAVTESENSGMSASNLLDKLL